MLSARRAATVSGVRRNLAFVPGTGRASIETSKGVTVTKYRITTAAVAGFAVMALAAGSALGAGPAPAPGKSCTKAGATATVAKTKVKLTCTKQGKKLLWVAGKAAPLKTTTTAASGAFSARFTGQAQVKVSGSKVDIQADASGNGALIGNGKLSGTGIGSTATEPCPVFTGNGQIQAANGDQIKFTVDQSSTGCPVEGDENTVNINGFAKVTGGTGKFAKVGGKLKFTGEFTRKDGSLTMQWNGSLTGV